MSGNILAPPLEPPACSSFTYQPALLRTPNIALNFNNCSLSDSTISPVVLCIRHNLRVGNSSRLRLPASETRQNKNKGSSPAHNLCFHAFPTHQSNAPPIYRMSQIPSMTFNMVPPTPRGGPGRTGHLWKFINGVRWYGIRRFVLHFGPQYSSDVTGDGPPNSTLRDGTVIYKDLRIVVEWSTFPQSNVHENPHDYVVEGFYTQQEGKGWRVTFPVLQVSHILSPTWIHKHGSTRRSDKRLITPELLLVSPLPPPSIKPGSCIFPHKGATIFVRWSTFPESQSSLWPDRDVLVVEATYVSQVKSRWRVAFKALGTRQRMHILDANWINQHGSTTTPGPYTILTKEMFLARNNQSTAEPESTRCCSPHAIVEPLTQISSSQDAQPLYQLLGAPIIHSNNATIGVATLNINSYGPQHLEAAFWLTRARGIDITCYVDTRLSSKGNAYLRRQWRDLDGESATITFATQQQETPSVGGQMHIIGSNWGPFLISTWSDRSQLGILHESKFKRNKTVLRILSIYWPTPSSEQNSNQLAAQLGRYLTTVGTDRSVPEYILDNIASRMRKPASLFILLGDFNRNQPDIAALPLLETLTFAPIGISSSRYSGLNPTGTIDHILASASPVSSGGEDGSIWALYSDHRPIWAHYVTNHSNTLNVVSNRQRRCERPLRPSSKELKHYQEQTEAFISTVTTPQVSSKLEQICKMVYECATKTAKPYKFHLWTPLTSGLLIWRQFLTDAHRGNLYKAILRTRTRIMAIGPEATAVLTEIERIPGIISLSTWMALPPSATYTNLIRAQHVIIMKQLHGKARRARLEGVWKNISRIRRDPYRFFKSLGPSRPELDLSRLHTPDGYLSDPKAIDAYLATHYATAFQPSTLLPPQIWSTLHSQPLSNFSKLFPLPNADIGSRIQHAICNTTLPARKDVEDQLHLDLTTPTLPEFLLTIVRANKSSAGGPSGCTYRHISLLSVQAQTILYELTKECWLQGGLTKGFFAVKKLYPIGKKPGDNSINNIRPIVLLEVIRKLWYKIITRKIQKALEQANILQPNQFGFRGHRSCADALLNFINVLEHADVTGQPVYCSSWDIVGAFNAPDRPLLELGLERLGVPSYLAKDLAYSDDGDCISLVTPYAVATDNGATFTTRRGCGQGDVISPLLWGCFFDMILTAINISSSNILIPNEIDELDYVVDTAFADDLLSYAATPHILQEKADIITGFAAIFGFKLAHSKFRCFALNGQGTLQITGDDNLPIVRHLDSSGSVKYLGSTVDLDYTYHSETTLLTTSASTVLDRIRNRIHRPAHFFRYANSALNAKLLYPASYGVIPRQKLDAIARQIGARYKLHAHVAKSFPQVILTTPTNMGGLGFQYLPDFIAQSKWRILQTALVSPIRTTSHAARAIVARGSRLSGSLFNGAVHEITHGNTRQWISDITELLHASDAQLTRCHGYTYNALDSKITASVWMQKYNITYRGDIMEIVGDHLASIDSSKLSNSTMIWPVYTATMQPLFIRIGHIWSEAEGGFTRAFLFHGWLGDRAVCSLLYPVKRPYSRRVRMAEYTSHPELQLVDTWSSWTHKFVARKDNSTWQVIYAAQMHPARRLAEEEPTRLSKSHILCSDGSYTSDGTLFGFLRPPSATAGVVAYSSQNPDMVQTAFAVAIPPTRQRAFAVEIAGLAIATAASSGEILTDCLGAVKALTSKSSHPLARLLTQTVVTTRWVRSHPERRIAQLKWTFEDRAIHAADNVASSSANRRQWSEFSFPLLRFTKQWAPVSKLGILLDTPLLCKQENDIEAYFSNKMAYHKRNWSYLGYQFFMTSTPGSIPQRAARAKLYMAKFDLDRQVRQKLRSRCSCGCANDLQDWATICTRPTMVALRRRAMRSLQAAAIPPLMLATTLSIILSAEAEELLRGHWSVNAQDAYQAALESVGPVSLSAVSIWRNGFKTQQQILTTWALDMYSNETNNKPALQLRRWRQPTFSHQAIHNTEQIASQARNSRTILQRKRPHPKQSNTLDSWLTRKPP